MDFDKRIDANFLIVLPSPGPAYNPNQRSLPCLQESLQLRGIPSQYTSTFHQQAAHSSTSSGKQKEVDEGVPGDQASPNGHAEQPTEEAGAHPYADFSREELSGLLLERDGALAQCNSQVLISHD